ncbi:MAG: BREX-4 system phosphatase PglZ [Clostridia bacterium]|nr:BREX-4 system phosphatase PglZ [Clostridia bacterium]
MLCREVQNYISSAKGLPFFYVVGDTDYHVVLDELKQAGVSVVRMSDFCHKDDKFPSVDDMVDYFRTSDVDYRDNKFVVVGLGEYLALRGDTIADKELQRLKNTTIGNARVILLLRGVSAQATKIIHNDNKMKSQQRAYICADSATNISITNMPEDVGMVANPGMKSLLQTLEDGNCGNIYASTALILNNTIFPLSVLSGAYSVVNHIVKNFTVDRDLGTEEQWQRLLNDLNKCGKDISAVFNKNGIDERIVDDLCLAVSGMEYKNWLVFLYFKLNVNQLHNSYFKLVIEGTRRFKEFKTNLIVKITEFSHEDRNFKQLYDERKKLLKDFPEEDIAIFVRVNGVNEKESIYRLTDNTLLEKKTVVKWLTRNGFSEAISYVYPALDAYLKKYTFDCSTLANELTEYFDLYKQQKILNYISDDFIKLVEKYASDVSYAQLPTRDNAINAVEDKSNAYLYWIDALGVEYLSYISTLAKKKGLSIHVDIVRSDLPTITTINKQFYDQWTGGKKYKEERLDNIKHKDKGGYFFTDDEDPIHIPAELEVIEKAMNTAAMELGMHNCKSFIIASDHGASRLAVIKKQEVPYETDTKGEHSGRCCKTFEGCDVPYKVEENNFIILSDYGRFRGSRPGNVEVHGGASLEEIVVPVITLTLKKQTGAQIIVINPDDITADRHNGVTLNLYISDVEYPNNISLVIEDKTYSGKSTDEAHYTFEMKDIKRAKTKPYTAEVYDGEDLIGSVSFKVKGKLASFADEFNFGDEF